MKKKYVFLFGLAAGFIVPLVLAMNQYVNTGKYQLYFGKVISDDVEMPVCFRLNTETGETREYQGFKVLRPGNSMIVQGWKEVAEQPVEIPLKTKPSTAPADSNEKGR